MWRQIASFFQSHQPTTEEDDDDPTESEVEGRRRLTLSSSSDPGRFSSFGSEARPVRLRPPEDETESARQQCRETVREASAELPARIRRLDPGDQQACHGNASGDRSPRSTTATGSTSDDAPAASTTATGTDLNSPCRISSGSGSGSGSGSSHIMISRAPTSKRRKKVSADGANPPVKRRRSTRDRNRLVVDKSSLFYRRMRELFFDEAPVTTSSIAVPVPSVNLMETSDANEATVRESRNSPRGDADPIADDTTPFQYPTKRIGNYVLHQVYQAPNVYVIDHFLGESDLAYFRARIRTGTFQRSYVDGPTTDVQSDPEDDDNNKNIRNDDEETADSAAHADRVDDWTGRGSESGGCGDDDEAIHNRTRVPVSMSSSFVDRRHRTSTFLAFDKQQDSRIAAIEKRASELLGCWSSHTVEPLQLVRYEVGQFFNVHHDLAEYDDDTGRVELPPKSLFFRRRVVTLFCYLNDVEEGGETAFPSCPVTAPAVSSNMTESDACRPLALGGAKDVGEGASTEHPSPQARPLSSPEAKEADADSGPIRSPTGEAQSSSASQPTSCRNASSSPRGDALSSSASKCLQIRPRPGRAVLWSNVLENGHPDPRTIHAGLPVRRGTKYGINLWICEG